MNTYILKFKTMGMTFCGGQITGSLDSSELKKRASELMEARHVRSLEDAWLEDSDGKQVIVLNMHALLQHKAYEWLTIR